VKFSVCIPSIRAETLQHTIDSLHRQTWTEWEALIIGQGHDPALRRLGQAAASADPRVRYLNLDNRGLSLARNAGIKASTGDVIAMIDDDCEAHVNWLAVLADGFRSAPDLGLIGGALIAPKPNRPGIVTCPAMVPSDALYDPIAHGRRPPPGWDWVGANFAMRRSVAEVAGPFDEALGAGAPFPAAEDTDYKLRLERFGIKMLSTSSAIVFHSYGHRYGLRSAIRSSRNYASGNGGLAGKLTLLGDPRGREWVRITARQSLTNSLRQGRPHRLPIDLVRLWQYLRSYRRCLREYIVQHGDVVLHPINSRRSARR
jgi:glycosyltransferase involved in cell wall biosynthesis